MERTPPRQYFNAQPYPSRGRGRAIRPYNPNDGIILQPYTPMFYMPEPGVNPLFRIYRQNDCVNNVNVKSPPKGNNENKDFNAQNNNKKNKQGSQVHLLPEVKLKETTFEKQCLEMIECIQMTEKEAQWKEIVLNDVANIFRRVLPGVIPQMYGSAVTGIAFNTSDFDVHLHTHGELPEQDFIKKFGGFVYRSHKFKETIKVARARVPVVKTKHIGGIELDISATSQDAVYNSILIKFLMESDSRIRYLTMLISYWSKRNNIAGRNLFTSYSMVLLVIFYLQRTDPPILPPMKDLLYLREKYAWPYALRNDAKLSPLLNTSNFSSLFLGFFNFYHKKDFSKVVLSTYLGKEILVEEFDNFETLTDDLKHYKRQIALGKLPLEISLIQVQDPIELNINTTKCVYPRLFKLFQDSINRFVTETSILPMEQWLIKITTEQPLSMKKIMKNYIFSVPYKKEGNWRDNFALDFKTVCSWLLFEINDVTVNKYQKLDEKVKKKVISQYDFNLKTMYNVFTKRCKPAIKLLINGINPEEFAQKMKSISSEYDPVDFQAGVSVDLNFEKQPHPDEKVENKEEKVENKEEKVENKQEKVENKEVEVENKEVKVENLDNKIEIKDDKKFEFKDRVRIEFKNLSENPSNDHFPQIVHGFALHLNAILNLVIKTRMGTIEKKVEPEVTNEKTSKTKKKSKTEKKNAQNQVQTTKLDLEKAITLINQEAVTSCIQSEKLESEKMQIDVKNSPESTLTNDDFPPLESSLLDAKHRILRNLNKRALKQRSYNRSKPESSIPSILPPRPKPESSISSILPPRPKPESSISSILPPRPKPESSISSILPPRPEPESSISSVLPPRPKPESSLSSILPPRPEPESSISSILPPRPVSSKRYEEKKAFQRSLGISGPSDALTLTPFQHNQVSKPFQNRPSPGITKQVTGSDISKCINNFSKI